MNADAIAALNNFTDDICTVMVVLIGVMGPVWLLVQFMKYRAGKHATPQDAALLEQMTRIAQRMEGRVGAVERILDAETPSWRSGPNQPGGQYDRQAG